MEINLDLQIKILVNYLSKYNEKLNKLKALIIK
ncbi:hypothetical protein IYC_10914 [Clostridium sporogenes PA 3679]|nr:hypothetical protein IYC_10914 [Clostridium sporogenes PA 3679]